MSSRGLPTPSSARRSRGGRGASQERQKERPACVGALAEGGAPRKSVGRSGQPVSACWLPRPASQDYLSGR